MAPAILVGVWALWPILAFAGGLGFAPATGLAALPMIPGAARSFRFQPYMIGLIAFFGYALLTCLWSPKPFVLLDVDLAKWQFNLRSSVVRLGLLFLSVGVVLSAVLHLAPAARARIAQAAQWGLLAQMTLVLVLSLFETQALQLLAPLMSNSGEGVQNLTRNSLIMAMAAPVLMLGLMQQRGAPWHLAVAGVVLGLETFSVVMRDVQAGLVAFGAEGLCIALVLWRPRSGFRVLGVLIALLILLTPVIYTLLTLHAPSAQLAASSSQYREAIWHKVLEMIGQHPVFGSGVDALRVLQTPQHFIGSGMFADQYEIPNHPHSMFLQLWLEQGAVGALLAAGAVVLAAFRLPSPAEMGPAAPRLAGLIGGFLSIALVSFDMWDPLSWAGCALLGIAVACTPARAPAAAGLAPA